MPDMEGDKLGGKITLIVSRGRAFGFKLIAFSAFLITISFLIIPYSNLFHPSIDFRIFALISLIPLTLGIVELQKNPIDRESATKYSSLNIASLFAVGILVNLYFIYLIK